MNVPLLLRRHFLPLALGALLLAAATPAPAAERPPQEYLDRLGEAVRSFNQRDFAETLKALDAAEKILPPTPVTLNTRGAVFIEQKAYAQGIAQCQAALKLSPRFYPARFNLAEAAFMQQQYETARGMFQKLLDENAKDELAQFRILLTYLMEKKDPEARRALNHIPFPGDTAAYYFGNAAWEYAHDNAAEAHKWIARGNWVFTPQRTKNFTDTFRQIGWLTGSETEEKAASTDNPKLDSTAPEANPAIELPNPPKKGVNGEW